jgi:asparagine synthase (glutamine-hydrolysing)
MKHDGAAVDDAELVAMCGLLARRGPDGGGEWRDGSVGLGHRLLATTPESAEEQLPLRHAASGCVITADVRLDNRAELLDGLGVAHRAANIGDAEIILHAYLRWCEDCPTHLLGDFAFAIWDPRRSLLLCARDQLGMRPFYYHHTPSRFFAFASEPRAILALPQTPHRINEGRIADFLVNQLEGIDKTSTFFEDIYRLPPAHLLVVTPEHLRRRCYWTLEPGPQLRLPSDAAYAEAFLDVFAEAVRCRLRSAGPVGSMLSGGMDSGSVVAVAREVLAEAGRGPLPTFSAVGPDPACCVETRTIHAALAMDGIDPHLVCYDKLDKWNPELGELSWSLDEPFDNHMTLVRVLYLAARRQGIKVMLDGVGGDVVLGEGTHIARLLRRGHWRTAYREAVGSREFWGDCCPAWRTLYEGARTAFVPNAARRLRQRLLGARALRRRVERNVRESGISQDFAKRINLAERLQRLDSHRSPGLLANYLTERAESIRHPYLTVGRERYDRVASALGIEPRDPFLDRRVVDFCVRLPGEQRLAGGWPKIVLRRAMAGQLPDAVRWRRGKEHLGYDFTASLQKSHSPAKVQGGEYAYRRLRHFLATWALSAPSEAFAQTNTSSRDSEVFGVAHLGAWLSCHGQEQQANRCADLGDF